MFELKTVYYLRMTIIYYITKKLILCVLLYAFLVVVIIANVLAFTAFKGRLVHMSLQKTYFRTLNETLAILSTSQRNVASTIA